MISRKVTIISAIVIIGPVLLAGAALLLVKALVTPEMIRKNVLPRVEKAVHRRIDMADAKIGLFSGIVLKGLKVYEREGTGTFLSLGEARLKYQLLPLLSRRVVVDEIVLGSPEVHMVRNPDGSFNFSDLLRKEKPKAPAAEEKTPFTFAVSSITVSDGRVAFEDRKGISGSPFVYTAQAIDIDIKNFVHDRPFPIKLAATVPGADIGFSGTVTRITDGPQVDVKVTVSATDLTKAVAGLPPGVSAKLRSLSPGGGIKAKLHLSGAVEAPLALLKDGEVRLDDVKLSAGGLSPVLSGKLDLANGALASRDLAVVLGKNRLSMLLKTSPLDRKPLGVELNANADSLDLDSMFPAKKGAGPKSPAAPGGGVPGPGPVKLPLSMSGAVNVKNAAFKGLSLSGVALRYRLVDNVLHVENLKGNTAGGSFLDNARIDLGKGGFSYSTRLALQGVRVEKLVDVFAPRAAGSLSGILSLNADLSGSGTSPALMKRNLAGSGSFDVRNGRCAGSGFMSELARFLGSEELRIVRFSSFAGTYRVKDGHVLLDSSLTGSDVRMKPTGRIGFDKSLDMTIDIRIAPRITHRVAGGTVGSFITDEQGWGILPLRATGTVGSPRFSLSGKGVGRQIGEKIGETLRKKLGKDSGTGQKKESPGLEDTIRGIFGK